MTRTSTPDPPIVVRDDRVVADDVLIAGLRGIVGAGQVVEDPELTARYRRDWTGRFRSPRAIVVRPGSTEEVAAVVSLCRELGRAIVPQGGNTGLVAGSIPLSGELVVSTERFAGIDDVTPHAGFLTAGAGTTVAELQRAARAHGWDYGVDLASRDSATLGGTIATNAGGVRVVRFGDTRHQVVGIEIVTGTGEVISSLGGTLRDNTGYHLPSIVTGSEGTLGVVTRARVRLVPLLTHRTTALLRFEDHVAAVEAAESMRGASPSVESVELFFGDGLELVCSTFGLTPPFGRTSGGYVLVETAGTTDTTPELANVVGSLPSVADAAVAEDSASAERLWKFRELHTESIASIGIAHKLDVALPPGRLAEFVERVPTVVASIAPTARTWLFGHGGESAVHVNVTGLPDADDAVDAAVLELVAKLRGSISAEHGIGRAKLHWIGLAHAPAYLALLTRLKSAFDPAGIMNPAVLLPPTT